MATVITFKKSSTQNATPGVSDLVLGELGVNTYHGRFYTEKNDGLPLSRLGQTLPL